MRKRTGATRWTQELVKALEHYLKGIRELPGDGQAPGDPALEMHATLGEELAQDVWHVLLDCDAPGRKVLKSADKHKRKKAKQQPEKGHKQKKGSRRSRRFSDSSAPDDSSSSSSTASSSSSSSGSRRKRSDKPGASSSVWSPAKPTMVIVDGKEHFRGKTSNNLINCSKPPQMKCRFCKAHHGFWEGPAFGCPGPRKKSLPRGKRLRRWGRGTRRFLHAVDLLQCAMAQDLGVSYAATAVRGLGISTVEGYSRQIRKMQRRLAMQPGESPTDVLESQMLWEVQQGHTEANTKKLLFGLRLLEKFNWIAPTVQPSDWLFINAFQNVPLRKQEGRTKQWAAMDCLRQLCSVAKTL